MSIDAFLLSGNTEVDSALGTVQMTCSSQSFPVVIDEVVKQAQGEEMGMMADFSLRATAQPKHVTNPTSLLNKRCTVDGSTYRILRVSIGKVAITFDLQDPAQP